MPADFYIDTKRGIVFSKGVGLFGIAEADDHMTRLQNHPDFRPEFNQLADFREVSELTLTNEEIRECARENIFSAASKRAFVVSSDLQFGLARMFAIHREISAGEHSTMVFREMSEALIWLGLSAEPDRKLFTKLG